MLTAAASAPTSAGAWRDDLLEDRVRVELAGDERPGPRELLGDRAVAPLGLEQLRSLEGSSSCSGEVVRELDLVVRERLLLREEDEPDAGLLTPRRLHGHGQERLEARRLAESAPVVSETVVRPEVRRRKDVLARRAVPQGLRVPQALAEELGDSLRKVVASPPAPIPARPASAPPRSCRRGRHSPPGRRRPESRPARAAGPAPRRFGRSRAGCAA